MWASIDQGQQQYLVIVLQSLVNTQNITDEKANERAKAHLLSNMDYLLCYNETTEHASNVTQVTEFLTVLRGLSDDGTREMLTMTQPRPPDFVVAENTLDEEETLTRSTARGTIGSNDTTAGLTFSSTGNARSMISTLTPEAGSTPIGADAGNAALKCDKFMDQRQAPWARLYSIIKETTSPSRGLSLWERRRTTSASPSFTPGRNPASTT